jgi:hypothetical protein
MRKKTFWTLLAILVVCAAPSAARAQGPGAGNPWQGRPALPALRDQGDSKDQPDAGHHFSNLTHLIPHAIPHTPHSSGSEWKYSASRFSPAPSAESMAFARGVSRRGRGILAAIGVTIAALFGGLVGWKKKS